MIYALGTSNRLREATDASLSFLRLLGEPLPARPSSFHVLITMRKVKKMLKKKTNEAILRLPMMKDPKKIAAMQVLNLSFMYAFSTGVRIIGTLMACRMIELTMEFCLTPVSCVSFSVYAAGLW